MKKTIIAVLFCITSAFANCEEMYEQFRSVLVSQMTALCKTQVDGIFGYKFYIQDENTGYTDAMLVFDDESFYLYFNGVDNNPFRCTDQVIYRTEKPDDILKVLFAPRMATCEPEFIAKHVRI